MTKMGIFDRLFKKPGKEASKIDKDVAPLMSHEAEELKRLSSYMNGLLSASNYVPKSQYRKTLLDAKPIIDYFAVLSRSGVLIEYCNNNGLDQKYVTDVLEKYRNFESLVDHGNETFIQNSMVSEKAYLDNILKDVDPKISLDNDQRRVVLTDEDYCLVIAGAGAGKTTTVAAKVKYLVEKKDIDPKQILVISFTNKAVQELKEKINDGLKIDCPISTFHSTGNAIIHKQTPEKLNIVDSSKLYYVIQDYFKSSILKNENLVNNLILFFSSYFDAPFEGKNLNEFFNKIAKSNYSTMRSDLEDYKREIIDTRTKKAVTIQNEVMRSYQEVEIANFLYLNGIDYEYEPIYRYDIQFSRKPYTPDFIITQNGKTAYIEHFGITQDGKNNRYSNDELEAYKKAINDKVTLHRTHGTTLLYTFSEFKDHKTITEHLQKQLEENGFVLRPRSNKEIMEKLVSSEENRYIRKLIALITRFITNFKTNGYTADEFNRMYHSTQNVRSRLFLEICNDCYLEYQRFLKENNAVDFEDMINESARLLREVKDMHKKLDFKYIIVDEYQDISRQRYDLVTALSEVTDAKIIAVGDDWQSIYAFSGSDISLFTNFSEKMGYAKLLKIVKTYRNSQEVIDIAGNFIQKNKAQITKELISPKSITDPVIIYTYDGMPKKRNATNKTGANYQIAHAVEIALGQIIAFDSQENRNSKNSTILLLGRFGFDGDRLEKSGLFEFTSRGNKLRSVKYPYLNITFMTAHASKGLGYDNVIVINGRNETYGFPSKIEDDPVLSFVIKGDRSIDYAEERRLFYVAMTRTKNRVYFIAPEQNPSEFLLEIKRDYKNVVLRGDWNENPIEKKYAKQVCPICGYPLQYRYKNAYGLRLWLCTNEPEVCGFMTNEVKAGKLSICKCDKCRDGYLIVKPSKNIEDPYFLGCTNYKKDKTGCDRVMARKYYYDLMNYSLDEIKKVSSEGKKNPICLTKENNNERVSTFGNNQITQIFIVNCGDPNQVVGTILSAVTNISKTNYFGKSVLIDVLRGSDSGKIRKNELNRLPEYGVLKAIPRDSLSEFIDWMISEHYILKTNHPKYPVLHPTPEGQSFSGKLSSSQANTLLKILR